MRLYRCIPVIFLLLVLIACSEQQQKEKLRTARHPVVQQYDFSKPQIYQLPELLNEISGIAFHKGNPDTVYAQQDEAGKLFRFRLGDNEIMATKFAGKGDYEDLQLCNDQAIVMRSDGVLYTFPFNELQNKDADGVKEYQHLLPRSEYEGMYADNTTNQLYILCKHCNEKLSKTNTGYILSTGAYGSIEQTGNFTINVKEIAAKAGDKKINFEPSALAKNERTGEWFILSSINKMLLITDSNWNVKAVYKLDVSVFNQPEGIAFDTAGNLYISNEKGSISSATIVKLHYQK